MLGERSEQRGLWEADRLYLDHVGKDTFYGLLASLRGQLFRDAEFAEFYCADNGRDSVPPSLLATALLLQTHDKVSDAEAKARADFDIRWKVALGIEIEDRPFAKSTLQVFRAQLILHDKVRAVFESSLRLARESGYLKKRGMRVALDTTNILGRGAVRDTCNLLAELSSCCGRWQPWRDPMSRNGPRPVGTSGTWGPASRESRPSTGPTAKHVLHCWVRSWLTRTVCWKWRGRRRRLWRRAALSERASWRRQSCWGSCCSRMWSARGTIAMATVG